MRAPWLVLTLLSASWLPAQAGHAVVAVRQTTVPATALLDVDLATRGVTALGRFPSDHWPPLALVVDPVDRSVVVAVDTGPGGPSLLLDLERGPAGVARENVLAAVQGVVEDLVLGAGGTVFAIVGGAQGGVVAIPRTGGTPVRVTALPLASAGFTADLASTTAWVAQDRGASGSDPVLTQIDLLGGGLLQGPIAVPVPRQRITSVVGLTALSPRLLIGTDLGRLWLALPGSTVLAVRSTPPWPATAIAAMRALSPSDVLVLGDAVAPYLQRGTVLSSLSVWVTLAGPLPGDPVDFDLDPATPASVAFGRGCPAPGARLSANGVPALGNDQLALELSGAQPASSSTFLLGVEDRTAAGQPLPWSLPGGCQLLLGPLLGLPVVTDASGRAVLPLPIPSRPGLSGVVFAQAVQGPLGGLATSAGLALHIAP